MQPVQLEELMRFGELGLGIEEGVGLAVGELGQLEGAQLEVAAIEERQAPGHAKPPVGDDMVGGVARGGG